MPLLPFLHFGVFIITLILAVYILIGNYKSNINRSVMGIFLFVGFWNLTHVFIHNPMIDKETAMFFIDLSVIGFTPFIGLFLRFSAFLSGNHKLANSKYLIATIIILPLVLITAQIINHELINEIRRVDYGWRLNWKESFFSFLFYFYFVSVVFYSTHLLFRYYRTTKNKVVRRLVLIIFATSRPPFVYGSLVDIIFPNMHIMSNIPESSNISIIIWIIGLIVATRKYGLFIFTPATAANNIIKIMSDPLFMVKPNGVIAHINPAASRLLRRESYQIINKPFLSIFQSPLIDQTNNLMNQSKTNIEGELLASNGNKIPVLLSSSIIRDDTSDILGVVCITRDITEQKKNKEKLEKLVEERTAELKKAKMKAEESDKLKSAFLANMSHEIRTPMNAIIGFSDMMKHDDINEEEKNIIHDQIHDNGIMLLNIIDDIIDVAKIDSGQVKIKPTKTEIKKVLDDVYLTIREIIRSKKISDIELHKKTPQESFFVVTDPFRLKQILINLLKNAIKFTNAGYVQFGYNLNDQNEIEFFVEDTGIGISKSDLEKIFDRFQKIIGETDERFYNGTGLGLSISKELVELLGGRIWVESTLYKGSTFYFTIPVNKDTANIH